MIFRIKPIKDTFISNVLVLAEQKTGSNYGYAECLDVFKIAGVSGALGVSSGSQLSRILLKFDTSSLDAFLSTNNVLSRHKTYYLRLQNQTTADGLPTSFDLNVIPVSGAWDEGTGMDTFDSKDDGYVNWWKRTSTDYWALRGGDVYASPVVNQHFDPGDENLYLDITSVFEVWASGTVPNDGLMVKLTASVEVDTHYQDYYKKSFYSRHSRWQERHPYVEIRWNDFIGDDRGRMSWNKTGSLFLHNIVDGVYTDLSIGSNTLIMSISDASGVLTYATASHVGLIGVYSASFALPTGSYSGSLFYDTWGSGSFAFMTGSFTFKRKGAAQNVPSRQYVARVTNLRDMYDLDEVVRFDVFVKEKNYRQNVILTASVANEPDIIEKCYYAIENDSTRERVIGFGTGSQQHTRLSYDVNGNYFTLPMSNFYSGEVYRVIFFIDKDGQRQVIDGNSKFRIR